MTEPLPPRLRFKRRRTPITKEVMDRTPHRAYKDDGQPWPGMGHITRSAVEPSSTAPGGDEGV